MIYSDKVMDHFQNPRNVGTLPDADGVGQVGNPVCGDMMTFYVKVKDNRLTDVKFQTFGCGAAIAVSSMVSEMALGKTVQEDVGRPPAGVLHQHRPGNPVFLDRRSIYLTDDLCRRRFHGSRRILLSCTIK